MDGITITAKTLDEAITKACIELGVTSEMLDYKIEETGSNGVFGIGAKPYVISASAKCSEDEASDDFAAPESKPAKKEHENVKPEKTRKHNKPDKKEKTVKETAPAKDKEAETEKHEERQNGYILSESEVKEASDKACDFIRSVLEKMGVEADVSSEYDEALAELYININGDDMGVLIGKRGQTLDALQYITGQVINKHQKYYVRVKLDTENYRERRKETLETLAKNIAHKVRRTKRPVALEPMNPYERRIIHSSLQNEKDVMTRSEGEEPYRHVVVCPAKHKK